MEISFLEIFWIVSINWVLIGIGMIIYSIVTSKNKKNQKYLLLGILLMLPLIIKLTLFTDYNSPNTQGYKELFLWFVALFFVAFYIILYFAIPLTIIGVIAYFIAKKVKRDKDAQFEALFKKPKTEE